MVEVAFAAPTVYFDDLHSGRDQFNATINAADPTATVTFTPLTGLTGGTSWVVDPNLTISATGGNARTIQDTYLQGSPSLVAAGETTGQAISMNAQILNGYYENAGLTFTFAQPVNAFGIELGDWGTCCWPSSMFVQFDNDPPIEIGTATSRADVPEDDGTRTYTFIGAIDDSATFSTVKLFGTGTGDFLYAGGTMLYANVALNAVSGPGKIDTAQPSYDETEAPALADPVTFAGGTFRPTADTTWNQDVVIEATDGFIDPNGQTVTIDGDVSGAGKLTVDGGGVVTLNGTNTFLGGVEIDGGATVQATNGSSLGPGDVTIDAGELETIGNFTLANDIVLTDPASIIDTVSGVATATGDITGAGRLVKEGAGTLALAGTNTFTGGMSITDGTVQASSDANLGAATISIGDGTLASTASFTTNNNILLTDADAAIDTGNHTLGVTGNVTGNGALNKEGIGTLALSGANTFSGGLNIEAGTVQASADANLGTGPVTVGNGTLEATGSFSSDNSFALTDPHATFNTGANTLALTGDISGTGALNKTGAGTLALSGPNSFSGGLNIAGGTVQVADDPNLGTGPVSIGPGTLQATGSFTTDNQFALTDSDAAIDTGTNTVRILGGISGNGALNKEGAGTLNLAGTNTFSGGLNIDAGTVQASDDANLGASPVTIGNGTLQAIGSFATDNAIDIADPNARVDTGVHTLTLAGTVSGDTLVKDGDGTLRLTGHNTQNGVHLLRGTIEFDSDAALGAPTGIVTIENSTTLRTLANFTIAHDFQVNNSTDAAFDTNGHDIEISGDIDGSGEIRKIGAGTLTLSGSNSQVLIDVLGGSVQVTSGDAIGSSGGSIVLHDNASFAPLADLTVTQNVSFLGQNASIDTADHTITLTGTTSGTACMNKLGSGTLNLEADGSNDVGACIHEGKINFDAAFAGNVWADAGGTAGGSGKITGNVAIRGTMAPGNRIGQLVVVGDVTQKPGSALDIDIDGKVNGNGKGKFDTLVLAGAGSVYTADGTLAVKMRKLGAGATNSFKAKMGDTFAVVSAKGGVKGTFDAIQQPKHGIPSDARFDAIYTDNQVILAVTPDSYAARVANKGLKNAVTAAKALDKLRTAPGVADASASSAFFAGLIGMGDAKLASTFQQASGEIHADAMSSAYQASRLARSAVTERLSATAGEGGAANAGAAGLPGESADVAARRHVWAQATGAHSDVDGDGTAKAYNADSKGIAGGVDGAVTDNIVVGLAGTITQTDTDAGAQGTADTTSYEGLAYASLFLGGNYLNAIAGVAYDDYGIDRHVDLATGRRDLNADADGRTYSVDLEGGRSMALGQVTVTPAAGVSWDHITRDGVTEKGANAVALSFGDESRDAVQARIGSRISTAFEVSGTPIEARAEAFYLHEFGDNRSELDPTLNGATFASDSPDAGSNGVRLGVGAVANVSQFVQVFADYRAELWSDSTDQSVRAGMTVKW